MPKYGIIFLALLWAIIAPQGAPAVLAGTEGTISCSFTAANMAPTITVLETYSDSGLTQPIIFIAPQVEVYIKVTAQDANSLDDIKQIQLQLFFDANNDNPSAPGVPNTQNCAIFTWNKAEDSWTVSAGYNTSWAIIPNDCLKPSNLNAGCGDWVFAIKVGKVAACSTANSSNWDIYAKAWDSQNSTGELYTRDREVLWYGEVLTSAQAEFGSVTPGTGYEDNVNEVNNISVTYIANGDYDQKVKSSPSWNGNWKVATFDASGNCNNPQEFSLKAFKEDTYSKAVQVDTIGVSIDATGTRTEESGNTVATNTLWLKVSSVFAPDTYSGTITYIIAER